MIAKLAALLSNAPWATTISFRLVLVLALTGSKVTAANEQYEEEQALVDEVTQHDFAPQACLSGDAVAAWNKRDFTATAAGSAALDLHLTKKLRSLKKEHAGNISKSIKGNNFPSCGNWCRKYPMRFSGEPPVMDPLDRTCKKMLHCFRDTEWSCDCYRQFAYDIYANRDPAVPVSKNEDYVFVYFSEVAQCVK